MRNTRSFQIIAFSRTLLDIVNQQHAHPPLLPWKRKKKASLASNSDGRVRRGANTTRGSLKDGRHAVRRGSAQRLCF